MFENFKKQLLSEQHRWFLFTPVLFGLGIGLYFLLSFEPSALIIVCIIEVLLVLLYLMRKNPPAIFMISTLLIVALGFVNISLQTLYRAKRVVFIDKPETTYIQGKIFKIDLSRKGKTRLWLKDVADFNDKRKGIYKITLSGQKSFDIGSCIETVATFKPLKTSGYYQFERDLFFESVSATGFALSDAHSKECVQKSGFFERFIYKINRYRNHFTNQIQNTLDPSVAGIAAAIITGDKSLISTEQYRLYSQTGLAHFLAISGLHMGFVAAISFLLCRWLLSLLPSISLRFSTKKIAAIFAVLMLFIYLQMSGCAVSAQRAFIMISLALTAFFFAREAISMRTVAAAALIILIFEPYVLVRPSFQMSFAAASALTAFYETYQDRKKLFEKNKTLFQNLTAYFLGTVIATTIATLATLLFVIHHFANVPLLSTLTNALAAPIIGFLIMPAVIVCLIFMPFGGHVTALKVAGLGISLLNRICLKVLSLFSATPALPHFPLALLVVATFGGLWLLLWQKKWQFWGLVPIGLSLFLFVFVQKPDIFYSANGRQIGLKDNSGNLVILAKKEDVWLSKNWLEQNGYTQNKNIRTRDVLNNKIGKGEQINISCNREKCVYENIFEFDLNGHLKIKNKPLNASASGGGFIYLNNGKPKVKTVRDNIGFRPWNSF
ncbi:MAG: ComEC/Rec2 family competence protein [Alphaproteobacteria bacterium]|nr:ComEC/Rec2 family competence protein [Alphaproteobacteria bacterium]